MGNQIASQIVGNGANVCNRQERMPDDVTMADVLRACVEAGFVYVWLDGGQWAVQSPAFPHDRPGETLLEVRRREGLCTKCGAPVALDKTQCPQHLQEARDRYYARKGRKER